MIACITMLPAPVMGSDCMGRRELIVKDLRLTTNFCRRNMVDVMMTMIAAIAAAKFA